MMMRRRKKRKKVWAMKALAVVAIAGCVAAIAYAALGNRRFAVLACVAILAIGGTVLKFHQMSR